MKIRNLRVDTPIVHGTVEFVGKVTYPDDVYDGHYSIGNLIANNIGSSFAGNIRIKSITFRATNVFGDYEVHAFGRTYFGMFRSNVMDCGITSEDHISSIWTPCVVNYDESDKTKSTVTGLLADFFAKQENVPEGITVVVKYSLGQ